MSEAPDVLIVGGGPTGLALANVLGGLDVATVVVEHDGGVATQPRAVSIDDEAMRFMQSLELLEDVNSICIPGTGTRYYGADGGVLAYARGAERLWHGHRVKNLLDHSEFQGKLLDGLARFPSVRTRHRTTLTSLSIDQNGVLATVEEPDGARDSIRARYAVGCDGGRSTVRKELGIRMLGSSSAERWLVVDTLADPHRERYAMHHGDPRRPHVIIIGRDGRCRYEFLLQDDQEPEEEELFQLAREYLAPYRQLRREEVVRCVVYTFHSLVASRWREGPVLLAGDAAHMMPPFAGQGLNSGLRDAFNLGWRMGLLADDRCSEQLLDSYEAERRPHVEAMLRLSVRMGDVVMTRSRVKARLRDLAFGAGRALPPVRRFLTEMRFKPQPHNEDGLQIALNGRREPAAGEMVTQARVYHTDGSVGPLDDVLGPGFALLALDLPPGRLSGLDSPLWELLDAARISARLGDLLPFEPAEGWHCVADDDGSLAEQLATSRGKVLVVRPDRFIVGAFRPAEEREFARRVGEAMGARTAVPESSGSRLGGE